MRLAKLLLTLALLLPATAWAQTGKIAGQVTDASTGEALPGVNVAIVGTTQGAVTDAEGYYNILNVRSGAYDLQASFIGFATTTREGIRVSTDLTTTIDFAMQEEVAGLEEVVVMAEQPIVQADVSANVANLSAQDFADLPVAGITEVLDLQAGIEPDLRIRGGGLDEVAFLVDGLSMRTGRANAPMTNISYTSLEEVQVQTGGFSAEYGNVRSGIVNVTTKEPPRDRYTVDALFRFTPAQDKTFDAYHQLPANCDYSNENSISPECNSPFARPVLDPRVRDAGPEGIWDGYQIRQYNAFSGGWNGIVEGLQADGFDVTNADMIEHFKYVWRKDNEIDIPDYDADITVGGPIPGISNMLGDLRFLASYRGTQTAYLYPMTPDAYKDDAYQIKLITNLSPGMKLTGHYLANRQRGQLEDDDNDRQGTQIWDGVLPHFPWSEGDRYGQSSGIDIRGDEIFTDAQYNRGDIDHDVFGLQFTHTLNQNTFYEVGVQRMESKYRTKWPTLRDGAFSCPESGVGPNGEACQPHQLVRIPWTNQFGRVLPGFENLIGQEDGIHCFGGTTDLNGDGVTQPYCEGQGPMGYSGIGANLPTGESMGGHWVGTRDTSDVRVWTGRFDLTSQINRFLMLQTGAELIYSDYDMWTTDVNLELAGPEPADKWIWDGSPIQGAAYVQGKLEFEGMIANLGVRLEYLDPNTEWFDNEPYEAAFRTDPAGWEEGLVPMKSADAQVALSPRVGISFPITVNSKLYFNYGHFRQFMDPFFLIGTQTSKAGGIDELGNPDHPFPRTVAYELGFDQNLFDRYLLRISGFYRDRRNQAKSVSFTSLGDIVRYQQIRPWDYGDVRGAEFSISKNRGTWFQGFANYTFQQTKRGEFGFDEFFENSFQMVQFLRDDDNFRLQTPVAEPFARVNARFLTPPGFGPEVAGGNPLANFHLSLLGEWRRGQTFSWEAGGDIPEVQDNVRWKDFWMLDLRLTKYITTAGAELQLFADVENVLDLKHLYRGGAFLEGQGRDEEDYMKSLHLDKDIFEQLPEGQAEPYRWVPGDDKPGDYRDFDVEFQPIEAYAALPEGGPPTGFERQWAWTEADGYNRWNGSAWESVPNNEVDKVLDDKAYIDMPNIRFNTFLNPRRITLGVRVGF